MNLGVTEVTPGVANKKKSEVDSANGSGTHGSKEEKEIRFHILSNQRRESKKSL